MTVMEFDRLENSFALTVGDTLVPGASSYSVGAITTVLPSRESALQFIEANREDLDGLERGEPGILPVDDPWNFMRRAAGEGLAGIQSADPECPDSFMFMVRVEEAGLDSPTILASNCDGCMGASLSRTGVKHLSHAEVLHWERYDILDRVNSLWGLTCPFRYWEQGDRLFEVAADGILIQLANVPLLGDWNSPDGAFAFFTSEEYAIEYQSNHLRDGRNRMILTGGSDCSDPIASLKPVRVEDLTKRLKELREIFGMAAWCINPTGHREDSGFGRLWESEEDGDFKFRTVAGNWIVRTHNEFERIDEPLVWSGRDTIFWSGGQSIQLLPLDISFGSDSVKDEASKTPMSDIEIEEWVEDFLSKPLCESQPDGSHEEPSLDGFFISNWDSVTGESYGPSVFSGFLKALQYLAAFQREYDVAFRTDGATACSSIGFVGSGNEEYETLRGQRFQRGLHILAQRHFTQGYHPSHAAHLVSLSNATLRTMHIDFAGYGKDLLWASDTGAVDDLLGKIRISSDAWQGWKDSAEAVIDLRGKELVIERIGSGSWEWLDPNVQHFLSTALCQLEKQGHAPQLDYAPISIEIVKGLEVELVNVLKGFRDYINGRYLASSSRERQFEKFMYDGGLAPMLGGLYNILRKPERNASPLKTALHDYLDILSNGDFLTSDNFTRIVLPDAAERFRNSGAHSSPIPETICLECVDKLVGTQTNQGLISKIIEWKTG